MWRQGARNSHSTNLLSIIYFFNVDVNSNNCCCLESTLPSQTMHQTRLEFWLFSSGVDVYLLELVEIRRGAKS